MSQNHVSDLKKLKKTVIDGGYCIGCGACTVANSSIEMHFDNFGKFEATVPSEINEASEPSLMTKVEFSPLSVCPFSNESMDEDVISAELFREEHINHNEKIGYFYSLYAGFVGNKNIRENGSSGGFGTWIAILLLRENLIDYVVHVKENDYTSSGKLLFQYAISSSIEEIKNGAKSRYYPIELSSVLQTIKEKPGRYLIVGVPCFIKSVRLLMRQDSILKERIKFCLGLVCGHLKSSAFAESLAWKTGIEPDDLVSINFRKKDIASYANQYSIEVQGIKNEEKISIIRSILDLSFLTNWGIGLFKYKACDFCDDVVAETADITIGDAWLPQHAKDPLGTNIIIVRNKSLNDLLRRSKETGEIILDELSVAEIIQSQEGGFRHRRDGLAYRLYLKEFEGEWYPKKRVSPKSTHLTSLEKKRYELRSLIAQSSHLVFFLAKQSKNYLDFEAEMTPLIKRYYSTYLSPFQKLLGYVKSFFKKFFF